MEFEFIDLEEALVFFPGLCERRSAVDETDLSLVHIIKPMVMGLKMDPFFSI